MTLTGQRRGRIAAGGVLLVVGVIGFLAVQTLDAADSWGSVLSAVAAVAGLVVSLMSMIGARQNPERSGQSVSGSTVGGGVRQIRGVGGSVRIGAAGPVPAVPVPETPAVPSAGTDHDVDGDGVGGGQSVDRSQVTGSIDQVDQVRGDVEFDR